MADTEKTKSNSLTTLVAIVAAVFGLWGVLKESNSSSKTSENERLEKLETRIEELISERNQYQSELLNLRLRVGTDFDRVALLEDFLDQLPGPAWVKRYDGEFFRMVFINAAYYNRYGKTKLQYVGKTDFDVWPQEMAERFHQHDMEVFNSRTFVEANEVVRMDEKDIRIKVIKFIVRFANDTFGVGGIQFDYDEADLCSSKTTLDSIPP